jgi:hypothetical protein
MGVPAHAVRVRHPAAEGAEIAVVFGPEHEMPMVRHQRKGEDPDGMFLERLGDNAQKRCVVGRFFKQRQSRHGAIEDMVNDAARGLSGTARHGGMLIRHAVDVKRNELRPLFLFGARCFIIRSTRTPEHTSIARRLIARQIVLQSY